jgi:hypothetical protein
MSSLCPVRGVLFDRRGGCRVSSQLRADEIKSFCLSFIKANSALVSSHATFDSLEACGDARLAVQVARVLAGGRKSADKPTILAGRSQQKRKRTNAG